ncbi:MAG: sigma-70 family RNA polymerase sigma factor [Terriglobia bacterium]
MLSDAALMEELARQSPRALEQLYDRYSRAVYSLALRITRQSATAEEIVQDVFLRLWRNAHAYQPSRGPLEPWLLTLARNRALDVLRAKAEKQRRQEAGVEYFPWPAPGGPPEQWPEQRMDQRRRAELVRNLIGALPETQRRAIELAYFEGMTQSEIAAAMNEPLGTVKTWIRNGLLRLRQELVETE